MDDQGRTVGSGRSAASATALTRTSVGASGPGPTPNAAIPPGTVLADRYRVLALLGEGGMGAVYKAEDLKLDRLVAIKVIRRGLAEDRSIMQRFKQELVLAREVTHHNVIRLYDLGEGGGMDFITMEFVEGEHLGALLNRRGKLSPAEATDIIAQVCAGLQAAHAQGIVHRDLKPGNIMLDRSGRVVVMDFGLARTLESTQTRMTEAGALVGTMEYMSPEQAKSEPVGARSDLFTVGLIFYELLTGVRPYQAPSAVASLLRRTQERAQPARTLDGSIPPPISDICSKCLEVDPAKRYQSALELSADLEAGRAGLQLPSSRQMSAVEVLVLSRTRKLWRAVAITAVVVAVAAIATIVYLRPRQTTTTAHPAVSVLVADFTNRTGESVFDDTLEPMLNVALEGARFISAFSRGTARSLARKLPKPSDKLDEEPARLVALSQGLSAVIVGELDRSGDGYTISAKALDTVTGNVLAKSEVGAANKDEVLRAIPKLAAPMRKALGDTTPESVQLQAAGGAFTAASLEVVHQYGQGMEQQFAGKIEDALKSFSKAAELDPNFARAYSGMAAAYKNLGQPEEADKYIKMAMERVDRLTERERYRLRGTYYTLVENWQKCVDEYVELVGRYPGDNIGHNGLANCYSHLHNMAKAVEQSRLAVQALPNSAGWRVNLSLFSSYGSDFQGGERESRQLLTLNPAFEYGYIALAFAQLGQGHLPGAAETYQKLEKLSSLGASVAASGLADLDVYQGRFAEAVRTLEQGAAADIDTKRPEGAAQKFAAIAYAELSAQHNQAALAAADKALAHSQSVSIRFLTARIFLEAGQTSKAVKLGSALAGELLTESQAHGKIIQGMVALKRGDTPQAIQLLTEANNLLDTWIGRFELGRGYLQAGAFAEADSEFDRCMHRRGESLALFLDEVPTYGYFPPVLYYQGRVREGLKSPGSAESYRSYLSIRGQSGEDPLVSEIHHKLGQ